ncbi:hypothetical protein [Weissella cibaria]|uniref:Uncharacterized protein n=1 Tax=Weissella cibaria TaxID=137591 RepID=A0A0D1JWJ6_9LACO|nr:hypothetical protein [Weissella cibaria]KIU25583.1 hypothetical protein ab3b_00190 [Weissella cibaria]
MKKLAWIISGLLFLSILIGLVVWSQTQPKLPVASQADLQVNLQPGSAHAVASQLNTYQRRVLKLSQGMVTSANATDDQNRIIYTIRTTNVSTELINFGLKHEQAQVQVQKLTDKVLGAMRAGGVTQPGLEIRILNRSGDALKILKIE